MAQFDLPLDALREYRPEVAEPDDFDQFWSRTLAEAAEAAPAELRLTRWDGPSTFAIYDAVFPGFGGEPIRGWFLTPRDVTEPLPCVVRFLGYGGGKSSPLEHLHWPNAGFAHLVMDTRGQGGTWGIGGETPDPHGTGPSFSGFMTRGIESPETYYYRRLFTDAARAVEAVRTSEVVDASRVATLGTSQGGGLAIGAGALASAAAVMADVPFLCHFERAITLTDEIPYREIVHYLSIHRGRTQDVLRTLSYVDGVNFAKRITAPAMVSVGLMDMLCPPSTVFAAANHMGKAPRIEVYPFNGHEGGEGLQLLKEIDWLRSTFAM